MGLGLARDRVNGLEAYGFIIVGLGELTLLKISRTKSECYGAA